MDTIGRVGEAQRRHQAAMKLMAVAEEAHTATERTLEEAREAVYQAAHELVCARDDDLAEFRQQMS